MHIEIFINDKISQLMYFLEALLKNSVHHTEIENFIWDCFEEWGQLNVTDETPGSTRERVFWHLIHELKLGTISNLADDKDLAEEITLCLEFLKGHGTYPIHCVGWRPVD